MGRGPSSGGIIKPFPGGRFRAWINHRNRRYSHVCATRTAAREWITATLTSLEHEAPPLTQSDMVAASAAKVRLPAGVTLADVIGFWLQHHSSDGKTVAEVVDAYLIDKEASGLRASTMRTMRWQMKRLSTQLGAHPIRSVERGQVEKAFDDLGAEGVGRDDTRRSWKSLWSWAIKGELAEKNPLAAITALKQDDRAPGILAPAEVRALLLQALDGKSYQRVMVPYLAIGLFAGLRSAELEQLTWSDIDRTAGHILVSSAAAKTRTRRYVTINATLLAWLKKYRNRKGPLVKVQTRARITRIASISRGAEVKRPVNAFRHSFASYHLAMWQDASKTAFELGHTAPDLLYRHYRNLVTKAAAEEFWDITPDSIRTRKPDSANPKAA